MKSGTKVLLVIGVIFVLIAAWFIGTTNNLVTLKEDVNAELSNVGTMLQRRSDLIPNLLETVKGYSKHEDIYVEIAEARSKLAGSISSGDIQNMQESSSALDSALSRLLSITEDYPDLEADTQFIALQDELAGSENRIAIARQNYNEVVKKYNTTIQKFPTSIIANMNGHTAADYFEVAETAKDAPIVKFD